MTTHYILVCHNLSHPTSSIICASTNRAEMEEEMRVWTEYYADADTHKFEIVEHEDEMHAFYEDFIEDANETIYRLSVANMDADKEIKHLKSQIEELKK